MERVLVRRPVYFSTVREGKDIRVKFLVLRKISSIMGDSVKYI